MTDTEAATYDFSVNWKMGDILIFSVFYTDLDDTEKLVDLFTDLPSFDVGYYKFPILFNRLNILGFKYRLKVLGKWYGPTRITTKLFLKFLVWYYKRNGEEYYISILKAK